MPPVRTITILSESPRTKNCSPRRGNPALKVTVCAHLSHKPASEVIVARHTTAGKRHPHSPFEAIAKVQNAALTYHRVAPSASRITICRPFGPEPAPNVTIVGRDGPKNRHPGSLLFGLERTEGIQRIPVCHFYWHGKSLCSKRARVR